MLGGWPRLRRAPGRHGRQWGGRVVPPRLRERNVTVNPNEPWVDTGINLRNGQEVYFQNSGQVTWSPNRRVDAEGTRNSKPDTNRPLPDRNSGALIGRIGERNAAVGPDHGPKLGGVAR